MGISNGIRRRRKVKPALFDVAQKAAMKGDTNSFSMENIHTIFLQQGITAEQFDSGINSFAVNSLVNKQIKAAEQMKVRGVPDFFILMGNTVLIQRDYHEHAMDLSEII